jgi:hypothetical protein
MVEVSPVVERMVMYVFTISTIPTLDSVVMRETKLGERTHLRTSETINHHFSHNSSPFFLSSSLSILVRSWNCVLQKAENPRTVLRKKSARPKYKQRKSEESSRLALFLFFFFEIAPSSSTPRSPLFLNPFYHNSSQNGSNYSSLQWNYTSHLSIPREEA